MEAAQLTPPRTGVNPTPADETPGLQSRDSRNPSLDHTLDYSKHEARLTRDPQPASSYHGTYREEDVNSALREEQKREWLSKKRTEYSATLLSPERDHPKDMSHAYQTCDVLTDGSLTMSWKSRQVLHQNLLMIKKVYTAYATYGVVEFTNSMNSGNFHRLIQDCLRNTEENSRLQGSLSRRSVKGFARYVDHHKDSRIESRDQVTIGPRDVELLFLEYSYEETQEQRRRLLSQTQSVFPVGIETLTERISESKILFEDFLNILLRLSAMIEPAEQEHVALNHFLKRNMEPLLDSDIVKVGFNDLSCVSRLKTILQNPTQLKMLGALYKNIQVYFTFYSSCRGKMDYKGFQSFFKDFGLYPSRVSANTLRNYFSALVSLDEPGTLYSAKATSANSKQFQLCIGCHQFVEGIALVLDDIGPKDADSFEMRLLIGIKALDDSSGRSKLFSKLSLEYQPEESENFRLLRGLENAYEGYLEAYMNESKVHIGCY